MAAPIIQNNEHIINEALLPKGSEINDVVMAPKNDPSDMEAVMNPCMSEPGWSKNRR